MADMGLDFQPPRRRAEKDWKRLESLWSIGVTFQSCGCGGPGYRPRNPADYLAFLRDTEASFRENLELYEKKPPPSWSGEQRAEARQHWTNRIAEVRAVIEGAPAISAP